MGTVKVSSTSLSSTRAMLGTIFSLHTRHLPPSPVPDRAAWIEHVMRLSEKFGKEEKARSERGGCDFESLLCLTLV